MNSLQELINILTDAITKGQGNLTLPVSGIPESDALVAALMVDNLKIVGATLSSTPTEVTVGGTVSGVLGLKDTLQATLTGQVTDDANLLQLQIYSLPSGWTFTSSFPNLPKAEVLVQNTYAFTESFLGQLVLNTPTFTVSTYADAESNIVEGLNFSAQVSVTGPLNQIKHLISAIPLLSLYGGITLQKTDAPLFDLRADLPAFNFNLGQTTMTDVHVTMKTIPPADEDEIMTSEMGIAGTLSIGSPEPIIMTISSALQNTGFWIFKGVPVGKSTKLSNGLADLTALISGSVSDLQLPTVGKVFSAFYLSEVSVKLSATDSSVQSIFVSVTSTDPWVLPLPKFTLQDVSTGWSFQNPLDSLKRSVSGYVSGTFVFGEEKVGLGVTALLPKFVLFASLKDVDSDNGGDDESETTALITADPPKGIKVSDILKTLTGSDGGIKDLTVTQFDLMIDPSNSSYSLETSIEDNWSLPIGQTQLILERMALSIAYNQTELSGSIAAYFNIFDTDFTVSAEKPAGDTGWIFSGSMLAGQKLFLQQLADGFLPKDYQVTLPAPLNTLALTELAASLNTKDYTYSLAAGFTWELDLIKGNPFEIDASFNLQSSKSDTGVTSYSGAVSGEFKVNDLDIKVSYQFQPNNNTLSFAIKFRGTTLTCALNSKQVQVPTPHTERTLTVSIGNLNVGEMIEYLVNLAAPSSNFKLSSPWDALNSISMKNLTLEINLYTNAISIAYTPTDPINLFIIKLSSIKLIYSKKLGQGTVDIELGGDFLGTTYDPKTNPLKWDLMNDPAPATPGAGAALLDLEYLGLGQHITLDTTGLKNVTQVIDALEALLLPVSDPTKNPMTQLKGLSFSQNSNWLIGTKFTVIGTVTLAVIFNDPQVYGLLIALNGAKAGNLAGLQFEILYKKVTDTIGVYHIELKLPDAMRHLEFGQVSITLPIIVLDIYTNGNFRVDFGFPWNGDFSRSFSVQVFPFVGYGGFYFNYLNGDTSTRVPKITNGNFNPVIEFGIGLSIGVGKTINAGVLSAGVSVTVQGILEGVIGWFNPNDKAVESARYYWVQGTISIVGKLYGIVDFVIISVNISVTAYASATLTIEAYKPILISLSAGVSVSASVKILFIRIHFSFSIQLNLSFTIGQASTPPWIVDQSGAGRKELPQPMLRRARALKGFAPLQAAPVYDGLNWTAALVLDKVYTPSMFILPAFTVAVPECTQGPTPLTSPQVQAVMLPFLQNSLPVTPASPGDIRKVVGDNPEIQPFNLIVKAMLGWSIYSLTQSMNTTIRADGLDYIYKQMTAKDADQTIFAVKDQTIYENLTSFLGLNFTFQVTGTADTGRDLMSATIFPIMPDLTMTAGTNTPVNFGKQTPVSQTYRTALQKYFKERLANAEENVAQDPLAPQDNANGNQSLRAVTDDNESMATVIFNDYFFMLAKSAVQAAMDALVTYQYAVQPGDKLNTIVNQFPAGATHAENIAIANRDVVLNPNTTLTNLGIVYETGGNPVVKYQVKSGDTLASIAAKFNNNTGIVAQNATNDSIFQLTATISYPASKYTVQSGDSLDFIAAYYLVRNLESAAERDLRWFQQLIIDSNNQLDFRTALTAGTTLQIPQLTINPQGIVVLSGSNTPYTVQTNDTLQSIAAALYPVPPANLFDPYLGWLKQAILELSTQGTNNQNIDFTKVLPTGTILTIPKVVLTDEGVVQQPDSQAFPYTSRAGDTLDLVAGYFLLTQLEQSQLTAIEANIKNANPGVNFSQLPATLNIPLLQHQIAPVDSFAILGTLFGATVDIATPNNQSASLLSPLAILEIPNVSHKIASGEKLTTIAAIYEFTVSELAEMISETADIFVPSTGQATSNITIPSLGEIGIQKLLDYLLVKGDFNNMAAMVSRFMLHGMRIPDPANGGQLQLSIQHFKDGVADGDGMCPLYQLTGQQFEPPQTITDEYDIVFANSGEAPWIEFQPTYAYTVPDEEMLAQIAQTLGVPASQIVSLNPNIDFSKPVPKDTVLTVPPNAITIKLTSDTTNSYPSTIFSPDNKAPERLPLLEEWPVRYTFAKNLVWQVPDNSLFPNGGSQLAGQPNLWLFPDTLVTKVQSLNNPKPFDLQIGTYVNSAVMQKNAVQNYFWATALQLDIRRILAQTTNTAMPGSYLSLGADQTGNDLLRAVYNYLSTSPGLQDSASIYLLYQPNPANANSNALASDILDRSNTFVLKTNLSTETHSGPQLLAKEALLAAEAFVAESGDYYANIASAKEFLQFLWEGSIVGTGGFYLNYATQGGGLGLPAGVFAEGDDATLWLVILLNSQSNPNQLNRTLYPFNNCAVVLDNIDKSRSNLFAEMTGGGDVAPYTTVAAGNIGFQLTRPNPETVPDSPEQRTQSLYNLLGFDIIGDTLFGDSGEMPPIGPTLDDDSQTGGLPLPASAVTDESTWRFHQIVPVYRFARLNNLAEVSGLPARCNNPYAGITKILNSKQQYELGNATFGFAFQDIYGNRTPPDVAINNLPIPVGYFDTIIGLSQWAGTASSYEFTGENHQPVLNVQIGLDLAKYIASPGTPYASAVYSASSHQERYRQLYYQVQQKQVTQTGQPYDLNFYLSTTLSQASDNVLPKRYPVAQRYQLTNFTNSAYLFLTTAMWVKAFNYTISDGDNFAKIAIDYFGTAAGDDPATLEAIVVANQNTPATKFLAAPTVQVPNFYVVRQGDTLSSIAAANQQTASEIATNNQTAPLNAGTVIALPKRTDTLKFADSSDNTLAAVAQHEQATVAGLAMVNETALPLLASGVSITYQGITVQTGNNPATGLDLQTFSDLVNYFNQQLTGKNITATAPDIAVSNQKVEGIFIPGATLTINDYVIQAGDTIAALLKKFSIQLADLVTLNEAVANFYEAGASLYISTSEETISDTDTLLDVANVNHITLQQLAFYNAGTALKATATVVVPNLVTLDPVNGQFSFYEAGGGETFEQIASLYNQTVLKLATDNQSQTGIFASGQSITLNNIKVPIGDYDTFDTLLAAFQEKGLQLTFEEFVNQIQSLPKLIAQGAFMVCSLPQLAAVSSASQSTPQTLSLLQIANYFQAPCVAGLGLDACITSLALVNSALKGFLQAGVTVYANDAKTASLTTSVNDTFNSLVTRFSLESGVTTTVNDLALANQNEAALVAANASFILPPISAVLNQNITAQYPDVIFPVAVKLEMERDGDLIDSEFKSSSTSTSYEDVSGVTLDRSTVAPRSSAAAGEALNLGSFAVDFETKAFPGLKIATGKQLTEGQSQSSTPPLWAVNFSTGGFSEFEIQNATPNFFAVRPLSTQLISRSNVPIAAYDGGVLEPPTPLNFQAIDMDVWVRDFLAAVDFFLTPEYAVPAYELDPAHAAFSGVVAAKETIADAVKTTVDYILQSPLTSLLADQSLKAAQEALYQQLLINLSNAYATDSIIQYPVTIQAPAGGTPDTAPRLSGKPVSTIFTTSATDTIASIALLYNVSVPYLAALIANTPRILNTKATLSYAGQTATMEQISDATKLPLELITLQVVADYFSATVEDLAEKLTVKAGGGLFAPENNINISPIKKTLEASDTFDSLAEFFNQSVNEIATANQFVTGIFAVTSITAGGQTVTVSPADSLYTAGQKFTPKLDASTLANELAAQTKLLAAGVNWYAIQVVPDYTLSTAKVPLTNGGSLLTLLFNTKAEAQYKKLFLDLNYVMNELEYDIEAGSNISDYQASSWLSFIIPIDSTVSPLPNIDSRIGQVEVPIPLRSYPTPPSLISQVGEPYPNATNVQEAKLWTYALTYERQDAAQDTDYLTVTFNTSTQSPNALAASVNANLAQLFNQLFNALAQFNVVYPTLKNDLALLPAWQPGAPNPLAVKAMNVFQQIVNDVANAWYAYANPPAQKDALRSSAAANLLEQTYKFSLETLITPEGNLDSLTVKPFADQPDLLPSAVYVYTKDADNNPKKYKMLNTRSAADDGEEVLDDTQSEKTWYYPDGSSGDQPVPAFGSVVQEFDFSDLDIVLTQNGWGGVYVTRNENLVSFAPTNPAFIYQTPLARFSNIMVPLIENTSCIPITFEDDLTATLNQLFNDLFKVDSSKGVHFIKFGCQYGYQLVSSSDSTNPCGNPMEALTSLVSRLPVLFIPKYGFSLGDSSLVTQVVDYINQWKQTSQASDEGGFFIFQVGLFSTLDAQLTQPLLEIENLIFQKVPAETNP